MRMLNAENPVKLGIRLKVSLDTGRAEITELEPYKDKYIKYVSLILSTTIHKFLTDISFGVFNSNLPCYNKLLSGIMS